MLTIVICLLNYAGRYEQIDRHNAMSNTQAPVKKTDTKMTVHINVGLGFW